MGDGVGAGAGVGAGPPGPVGGTDACVVVFGTALGSVTLPPQADATINVRPISAEATLVAIPFQLLSPGRLESKCLADSPKVLEQKVDFEKVGLDEAR